MKLPEVLQKRGIRAVFYGRHSTKEQNMDTQRHMCEEFASKHDMTIVKEYVDENVSGFKKPLAKRLQMEELRKDAREGKFDCVLVYKADRLARKVSQHMQIWGEFRELNIPIILTEAEKLYTTDNPNEIIIEIGLSSFESENTRVRSRDYYNTHTVKGTWLGGVLPFGYEYVEDEDGKKLISQISSDIDKVKRVFSLYKQGYGFKRAASKMNEQFPNDKWVAERIKSIITNPFYAGYTTSQRIVACSGNSVNPRENWKMGKSEKIPACITIEQWEECMEIYEKKKDGSVSQDKYFTPYLFKDILRCGDCGEVLQTKNYKPGKKAKTGVSSGVGKWRKYICPVCNTKWDALRVHELLIEDVLAGWHFKYFSTNKEQLQKEFETDMEKEIDEMEKDIGKLKKDILKLQSKLNEGERKQSELMIESPEPDELKEALVQFRLSIQKKIKGLNYAIAAKEKEKQNLQLIYGDMGRFREFIKSNTGFDYNLKEPDDPNLRRLILFLFVSISINQDYRFAYKARVDLDERGEIILGFPVDE